MSRSALWFYFLLYNFYLEFLGGVVFVTSVFLKSIVSVLDMVGLGEAIIKLFRIFYYSLEKKVGRDLLEGSLHYEIVF